MLIPLVFHPMNFQGIIHWGVSLLSTMIFKPVTKPRSFVSLLLPADWLPYLHATQAPSIWMHIHVWESHGCSTSSNLVTSGPLRLSSMGIPPAAYYCRVKGLSMGISFPLPDLGTSISRRWLEFPWCSPVVNGYLYCLKTIRHTSKRLPYRLKIRIHDNSPLHAQSNCAIMFEWTTCFCWISLNSLASTNTSELWKWKYVEYLYMQKEERWDFICKNNAGDSTTKQLQFGYFL